MSYRALLIWLTLACAGLFLASLLIGPSGIGPIEGLRALITGQGAPGLVMRELRLPRALLGVGVGAALGLSGAAMQGFLRNPLAEPGLIGTTAGAALGAVLAIQTGLYAAFALALPLAALAGAALAVVLIVALAGREARALVLILAGIAVSALAGAATALVLNLAPSPYAAAEIVFWMMGSLADRSMTHVALAAPFLILGAVILLRAGPGLDALSLGEDAAASMGISLSRLRLQIVFGTALMVGAATAVAGAVGFVGLVVPHLLRKHVGASPSRLLPASALGGAVMLLAADIATRVIAPERDLKLGVLTAIVGAPFFLSMIRKLGRET
ncbi:ABC transporter permease [Thioclava dalianensis]|uniref:ABC transporter permease n=1 Tax=Thioclava dalianensis TaxID=1185766 RepID=A0A074TN93_9RHOB|nr:iron ABC transporter permease [Thioclava dalianensis]KEP71630.1 ABC transporter permease [Thioclava dalianensis]SFN42624.1 iron complex transport system permease protein [Thioclava dalianensis]